MHTNLLAETTYEVQCTPLPRRALESHLASANACDVKCLLLPGIIYQQSDGVCLFLSGIIYQQRIEKQSAQLTLRKRRTKCNVRHFLAELTSANAWSKDFRW